MRNLVFWSHVVAYPIIASILTTCVAFIPLFFFSGRFGIMVKFIPPIVFLMLGGSLFEALFVLPGHMVLPFGREKDRARSKGERLIRLAENRYESAVNWLLGRKYLIFIFFVILFGHS